ncbi:MAG: thymidylate kinase [Desulfomicrobiaceae bacterium]|jgi:dTMP kinase|nr:thymidylate kinase [Desulfomicrobiaceae bacterium]MBZ4684462.1 thymidylate kinase [Desulfomicrobiaceae bacterium]MDI3492285.1 dTMP kinase [Desulfomicrobiaceae bacterium]MDK2872962.1 dTMP kinase [Desulfomicrobiaceae bacterium]HCF04874.1 dTMP kinase [Desulfomicrobiaceae bacterium]
MFLTLEGMEGCGKTTQQRLLAEYFIRHGHDVLTTREPGGSRLGTELRRLLLDPAATDITREAELFLYLADRAQHVATVIRPALDAGRLVLCDRFADSTIVYQGYGRGMTPARLAELCDLAVGGLWPDVTIVLDVDPETGLRRALARNLTTGATDEGRFEAEALAFHARVREGYLTWAALNRARIAVVDATGTPETVFDAILRVLEERGHV